MAEREGDDIGESHSERIAARRAIRAATYPALNPASMLTTATFAEQAFNMVRRGETPANAAP